MKGNSWKQLQDMQGYAGRLLAQARAWSRLQTLLQRLFPELFGAGARLARIRGTTVVVMVERAELGVLVRYRQADILQALQVMWPEPLLKLAVGVAEAPPGMSLAQNRIQHMETGQLRMARTHLDGLRALLEGCELDRCTSEMDARPSGAE
jgi:hypothetical protein